MAVVLAHAISWRPPAVLLALLAASPAAALHAEYGQCAGTVPERIIDVTPGEDYRPILSTLGPGDLLRFAAGTHGFGLTLSGVAGEPGRCILIEGPATGPRARFTARDCCNTVSLTNVAWVAIRHLELDGQDRLNVNAVKCESPAAFAHHVTLENLWIHSHAGGGQQNVGISTKCPAWNWVIRRNLILGAPGDPPAGTGLYLGNSDGSAEFVHSLIEYNLVADTIGYAMQIKHQNGRPHLDMPVPGRTVIRHNVFVKANNGSTGAAARPNLLVGRAPLTGPGVDDLTEVYGNLFVQNDSGSEGLFQGAGNIAFYANLLFNSFGGGAFLQAHEGGVSRDVTVFRNTVVAAGTGISVSSPDPGFVQRVVGNAAFAATPLNGGNQSGNAIGSFSDAALAVASPLPDLPGLDMHPLAGALLGADVDEAGLDRFNDWDRDFNGSQRLPARRGAYASDGVNPGWLPALERKPEIVDPAVVFADGFE
ncbi:MAG TPA: hypothetical protein PKZ76_10980 [Xanthomonadaceae bacterium]|nr:hypothetical protein [Xanthomonadaceae bacterium]